MRRFILVLLLAGGLATVGPLSAGADACPASPALRGHAGRHVDPCRARCLPLWAKWGVRPVPLPNLVAFQAPNNPVSFVAPVPCP